MSFRELKELIRIIDAKGLSDAAALGVHRVDKSDARYRLYDGIRNDRYQNVEDAAQDIVQAPASTNSFKLLKSRLRQQLIDALVGYDISRDRGTSAQQRAVYECVKGVYEVRSLMNAGALHVSRSQAERYVHQAIKHDVTEPAMQLSRMLRSLFVYMGDLKKAAYYEDLHARYIQRFLAEDRSEEIVDTLYREFSTTTDDLAVHSRQAEELAIEMQMLRSAHPTFLCTTNYFRVQCLKAHMERNHLKSARVGLEAISYLEAHPELTSRNRIAEFANIVMNEYFSLGDFSEAESLASRCFENYTPYSNQWYNFLSLYIVLIMHSRDYKKSMSILRKAASGAMELQPTANQERWKLYAGYLLYLHTAEFVRLSKSDLDVLHSLFNRKKFSFAFNYDLEVYAKDKTGMKLSVLILELLFAIEDARPQDILTMQEKLRLLYYRVLKADRYPRANAFFHLLQILMQEDFDTQAATQRSTADLNILRPPQPHSPETLQPAYHAVEGLEILRYEVLWSYILKRSDDRKLSEPLKNKRRRS